MKKEIEKNYEYMSVDRIGIKECLAPVDITENCLLNEFVYFFIFRFTPS